MPESERNKYIGYLPQDVELFEGSIGENISRFNEIDPEAIHKAAKIAGIHEMILRYPQGYDTSIGINGNALSGGQRQRIGLARAIYGDPKFIILDEPNANLDESGELALEKSLQHLKQSKSTVIIISHRKNVFQCVDKLLVLANGVITLGGGREQVLAKLSPVPIQKIAPAIS
jgi:ATP-binding cassette subfamily C protein EexD